MKILRASIFIFLMLITTLSAKRLPVDQLSADSGDFAAHEIALIGKFSLVDVGTYIDDVVCKVEDNAGSPTELYYHTDRQFNVRGLTDTNGDVVELYAYTVYGKQTVMDATGVVHAGSDFDNLYGFTGRYKDSETGLWYFRARYFDDELGRFISRDPLGFVDGFGLYNGYFASGFGLDPSGLSEGAYIDNKGMVNTKGDVRIRKAKLKDYVDLNKDPFSKQHRYSHPRRPSLIDGLRGLEQGFTLLEKKCEKRYKIKDPCCTVEKCKKEARAIIDQLKIVWFLNYGYRKGQKGGSGNSESGNSVGCFLCWDWSNMFYNVSKDLKLKCFSIENNVSSQRGSTATHWFLDVYAYQVKNDDYRVTFDDGFLKKGFAHEGKFPNGKSGYYEDKNLSEEDKKKKRLDLFKYYRNKDVNREYYKLVKEKVGTIK